MAKSWIKFALLFFCVVVGVSSQCSDSTDCADPLFPVCDADQNVCVACLTNLDCSNQYSDKLYCSNGPNGRQCVQCLSSEDCRNRTSCNSTCTVDGLCSYGSLQCSSNCNTTLGKCACHLDADCSLDLRRPVCWKNQSLCAECNSNSDCASSANGRYCNLATHKCVACLQNNQCQYNNSNCGGYCNTTSNVCVSGLDCTKNTLKRVCNYANGVCVQCSANLDCAVAAQGSYCDIQASRCVQCLNDTNCGNGRLCDPNLKQCVDCLSDNDCLTSSKGKICSFTNQCVECEDGDFQCASSGAAAEGRTKCDIFNQKCVECLDSSTDCINSTHGEYCNTETQNCTQCLIDAHCRTGNDCNATCHNGKCLAGGLKCGNCNVDLGICQCFSDGDCLDPTASYCAYASTTCVACTADLHCRNKTNCDATCINNQCSAAVPALSCPSKCEISNGTCGCMVNSDCPITAPNCNIMRSPKLCVECISNQNCSKNTVNKVCNLANSRCQECVTNTDCAKSSGGSVCYSGQCIECLVPQDCPSYSQCNGSCINNKCTPRTCNCTNDANCTDPKNPYCGKSVCVECTQSSQCSDANYYSCKSECSSLSQCSSCQCTSNTQCSGRYPYCVADDITKDK